MNEAQSLLHQALIAQRSVLQQCSNFSKYHYIGMEDFLLRHGQWYEPSPWDNRYERGLPKNCFANSMLAAKSEGLRYVEGVASTTTCPGFPFAHAWNLDAEGRLIDLTWMEDGIAYLGVEFSVGRAEDAIWNGNAHVLGDWERRHPLFKQPWTGEDFTRVWEPTEAETYLRGVERKANRKLRFLSEAR